MQRTRSPPLTDAPPTPPVIVPAVATDGYALAMRVARKCRSVQETTRRRSRVQVFGMYEHNNTQVSIIWKVGTTLLKRLFLMMNQRNYRNVTNPYDIPYNRSYPTQHVISNHGSKFRMVYVRNPYHRLLSGFVDKVLAPNTVYWKRIGTRAIKLVRTNPSTASLECGHDLEFKEYVKYVILTLGRHNISGAVPDGHFVEQTKLVKPCEVRYNFIGKLEKFRTDILELFYKINISKATVDVFQRNGSRLAADDAIIDTCVQPFVKAFQDDYLKCITIHEALQRAWLKLQIRGIIGRQPMPVSEHDAYLVTSAEFVNFARQARATSTASERKSLQKEHFEKMFRTVPDEDVKQLQQVFADDFNLFEYNLEPFNTL